ncbi:MAG TPA: DUF2200 domain-containing protein [Devosia sp.]|jgi:hypothetical protein
MKRSNERVYAITVSSVYPLYLQKVERKGRSKAELDQVIRWLTGYSEAGLEKALAEKLSFGEFFTKAPKLNPARALITGVICGMRVEEIEEPMMRDIRYLDKLVDELARGKAMEKILRPPAAA